MKTGTGLVSFARVAAATAALLSSTAGAAQTTGAGSTAAPSASGELGALQRGFSEPPMTARPIVWWHWMNGNITAKGVREDLEWMHRVGIGGVQNFDAALATPQVVDKRLAYMTPEWKSVFAAAVDQASGYGMSFGIAAAPGWSETGGPWVPAADGMKKIVWSTTDVQGGRRVAGTLAMPPATTGPFQSIPLVASDFASDSGRPTPTLYADVKVLAYPIGGTDDGAPVATAGGRTIDATALFDRRPDTLVAVDQPKDGEGLITLDYSKPRTIRSATFFRPGGEGGFMGPIAVPWLQAERAGRWTDVAALPATKVPTTASFAPVTASRFRIVLRPLGPSNFPLNPAPGVEMGAIFPTGPAPAANGPETIKVAEFRLSSDPEIDRFEAKAGFTTATDYYALSKDVPEAVGVDPSRVVDLTDRMKADGTLDWTPPRGRWRIVRFGTSLIGTTNHPATREATGLEVDKYDAPAVARYLRRYIDLYRGVLGADRIGARGLTSITNDSIESGNANWTPRMIEQFRRLRGYDPTPYMPTLIGQIVGSRARSDRFLYDYRRTLADLIASEHYGTIAAVARQSGLITFGEALEDRRPQLGDDIAMRSHADVPMAAMWTYPKGGQPRATYVGDVLGAASVANVYGRPWVAAESLTSALSPYAFAPSDLKTVIDLEFVKGVNRPVIHSSVHQPLDTKLPGLTLMVFGQNFNRHEAWAELAKPWVDYIARSSFMLQQGRHVADVAYFFGEEGPITALWDEGRMTDLPRHALFDYIDADALLGQLSVDEHEIVSKGGARYRLLYLSGTSERMTVPVLRKLVQLASAGATIVGVAPTQTPSLADDPAEFARLVARLWNGAPVTAIGSGRVIAGRNVDAALSAIGSGPDFTYTGGQANSDVEFNHRRLHDADIYFLSNRKDRAEAITARFRVANAVPELWHAETGASEQVSYSTEGDQIQVPLSLLPNDAVFVVFRHGLAPAEKTVANRIFKPVLTLTRPWTVHFQEGRGAPPLATFDRLSPLDQNANLGIKYFSGVATYTTDFPAPVDFRPGQRLLLDLGKVGEVAEVRVNGTLVGTAWHAPFRIDISKAVRRGANLLQVRVANLWVNRLVGDAQPAVAKIAYTSGPSYTASAPLRPSGLIGPVTLVTSD